MSRANTEKKHYMTFALLFQSTVEVLRKVSTEKSVRDVINTIHAGTGQGNLGRKP